MELHQSICIFEPSNRTAIYKFSDDFLLKDKDDNSRISIEDYGIVMIDAA
ncbi:hypothetical protein [Anaeromicrobium sediminis]|nr:hypothetical protein [Anaeromicrobium sediminis]